MRIEALHGSATFLLPYLMKSAKSTSIGDQGEKLSYK